MGPTPTQAPTEAIFLISVVDHGCSVSADYLAATPQVFGGENCTDPMIASSTQELADAFVNSSQGQ